jgi:phenylacetate-CoA ligase
MMPNLLRVATLISQMKLNQRKSTQEIRELQESRLSKLISHASSKVPYYRKLLKSTSVRSVDDLESLPILVKSEIVKNPKAFLASDVDRAGLHKKSTSGSTGMSAEFYFDDRDGDYQLALEYHQLTEAGVKPYHKQAQITYYELPASLPQKLGFFRRSYLSDAAGEMENLAALKTMKPDVLHTAPSFLVPLAHENLVNNFGLAVPKAFSFAEVLTKNARELVTKSFKCDLRDLYGATETSWMAWECEHGSMHVNSDSFIVEVVDQQGLPVPAGRKGILVVTPLWKRTMPFLRYMMNDQTALLGKCRCGRSALQVLAPVEGRSDDFLALPSGKFRSALLVEERIRLFPQILQYQAVQECAGQLRIHMILSQPLSDADKKSLSDSLNSAYGEKMEIEFEETESLPKGKTGKIRSVISKVRPSFSQENL